MREIKISDNISYIEATEEPLSADIGIIRSGNELFLYDVGRGESNIASLNGEYNVVLSHFHPDHTGNLGSIKCKGMYVSKETYKHVSERCNASESIIVEDGMGIGNISIFPIPSSHAKGCLGVMVDDRYAFVGDALYGRVRAGYYTYNVQFLKEEIEVLKALKAEYLLVSHYKGMVADKSRIIERLSRIYEMRDKNSSEIRADFDWID
ncbi:MAG: MBL fold metallo-hydrolase [Lachnospiraceae bacterium]|nr:MBL fold metallo-hydrolase [Lachnospiraceae bacterium]